MFYWLYERMLLSQIQVLPRHICFMISSADLAAEPGKCLEVTGWCTGLNTILAHRPTQAAAPDTIRHPRPDVPHHSALPGRARPCPPGNKKDLIGCPARAAPRHHEGDLGTGLEVVVAIGKSGREEITDCIRRLAENGIPPSEIDEKTLESCLTFRYDPDIVVKTGGDHLTDFLIWQSVYSELFFSDINWKYFRRVDFLRVLRDYQSRIRRFGK